MDPLRRCFSHMDSLLSPDVCEILFPISWTKILVEGPYTPEVSMAIGSNLNLPIRPWYFALLEFSAFVAARPASIADSLTELSAKVFQQVASQQSGLPWLNG